MLTAKREHSLILKSVDDFDSNESVCEFELTIYKFEKRGFFNRLRNRWDLQEEVTQHLSFMRAERHKWYNVTSERFDPGPSWFFVGEYRKDCEEMGDDYRPDALEVCVWQHTLEELWQHAFTKHKWGKP